MALSNQNWSINSATAKISPYKGKRQIKIGDHTKVLQIVERAYQILSRTDEKLDLHASKNIQTFSQIKANFASCCRLFLRVIAIKRRKFYNEIYLFNVIIISVNALKPDIFQSN